MRRLPAVPLLAACLLSCVTPPKPPPDVPMTPPSSGAPGDSRPRGEVLWKDLSGATSSRRATYDDWRVDGPSVSLRRTPDGRWAGKVRGRDVALVAGPGKVSGGDVALTLTFDDKGAVVVDGLWAGQRVHVVLARDRVSGIIPAGPIDLTEMGAGMFNSYQGLLQVAGPNDMPQVAMALLDVLVP